jgi:phage antirepressor YoqD-like protein
MATELQIIGSRDILGKTVNAYGDFENPLFLAKDVGDWIEHSNYRVMIEPIDDDEKGVKIVYTPGGPQESWFLTENGLYEVLFLSRRPIAKAFKKGVKRLLHELRTRQKNVVPATLTGDDLVRIGQEMNRLNQRISVAEQKIEADRPKVVFADAVSVSKTSILVGELAKILCQNGMDIGGVRLFEKLRKEGYLCVRGSEWNIPTQRSMDQGLFEIKETAITHADGHTTITRTPKVTGKGQVYFINKYLGKNAVCELTAIAE